MKYVPRQYQIEGAQFLKERKYAMLGDAPGVGKTGQAILAIDPAWKTLIVCPAAVKIQWKKALFDWVQRPSQVISSSNDKLLPEVSTWVISYDLLIREKMLNVFLKKRFDLIVYDEAHKLKSMAAKRTKVALGSRYLRPRTNRIWFLTGTPVKNRTVDLFPILKTCAPEVLGKYSSFLKFAYRYCGGYVGPYGLDASGASHTEELCDRLKSFMLRREKRDVLTELPARVIYKVDLECTPAVKKLILSEEEKTIEIAGEDDPSLFKLGESARIRKALAKFKVPVCVNYINDLLEETEKAVVFFYHKEVLSDLRRAFSKIPHVFIDGSVHPNKRGAVVEEFRTGKDIRLFFGQLQACGEGIDGLQEASSDCVFVEPSWSHTDVEQAIGRLERSGQQNDVNVHILVIEDTLESRMLDVVASKLNVDRKLYNQKGEEKMVKTKTEKKQETKHEDPMVKIAGALTEIAAALTKAVAVMVSVQLNTPGKTEEVEDAEVEEVEVEEVEVVAEEAEVTEDAIRARAGDICNISPDGTGKTKVVEIIRKIGGGKIADLKTPAQKKKAMEALDKLYNELDV